MKKSVLSLFRKLNCHCILFLPYTGQKWWSYGNVPHHIIIRYHKETKLPRVSITLQSRYNKSQRFLLENLNNWTWFPSFLWHSQCSWVRRLQLCGSPDCQVVGVEARRLAAPAAWEWRHDTPSARRLSSPVCRPPPALSEPHYWRSSVCL